MLLLGLSLFFSFPNYKIYFSFVLEKSAFSQSGDNDLSASAGDHGTKPRFYFHTTGYSNSRSLRNDVLAVFSFAAGLGLVSGLFLGKDFPFQLRIILSHPYTLLALVCSQVKVPFQFIPN